MERIDLSGRREQHVLEQELLTAGLSSRTTNALIFGADLYSIEQLTKPRWGDPKDRDSLHWWLCRVPGLGPKGIAEVVALRAGRDPGAARLLGQRAVTVPLGSADLGALDAWIAKQPKPITRPEAIRAIVRASLHLMGEGGPEIRAED